MGWNWWEENGKDFSFPYHNFGVENLRVEKRLSQVAPISSNVVDKIER